MHWKIFENILLSNECVTKKRFREILKADKVWRKLVTARTLPMAGEHDMNKDI